MTKHRQIRFYLKCCGGRGAARGCRLGCAKERGRRFHEKSNDYKTHRHMRFYKKGMTKHIEMRFDVLGVDQDALDRERNALE